MLNLDKTKYMFFLLSPIIENDYSCLLLRPATGKDLFRVSLDSVGFGLLVKKNDSTAVVF